MADHFPFEKRSAHKKFIFFLAGMFLVVFFGAEQSHSEESRTPSLEAPKCPENINDLRFCALMIYRSENPNIEAPDELTTQLDKTIGTIPQSIISSCPETPAQLGNCYAQQQVGYLKQYLEREIVRAPSIPSSEEQAPPISQLENFNKAENRWFERFKDNPIPTGAYQAYYFDSTNTQGTMYTHTVPKVAINYILNQGNGFTINSENFAGFWVGNFVVKDAGIFDISTTQGNSQSRVIINGYEIPVRGETKIALEAGTYQVEIEFLNNWHTTDFAMNLEKEVKTFSKLDAVHELSLISEDFDIWYVGIYESNRADRNVTVFLRKSARPVVLLLSAYSQVNWIIKNQHGTNILYVLHSSYDPGASVTAENFSGKIMKLDRDSLPLEYTIDLKCYDITANHFHCENIDGLRKLDEGTQNLFERTLDGFSGQYDVDTISVPNEILTDEYRAAIYKSYDDIRKRRQEFEESQKLGNIFK